MAEKRITYHNGNDANPSYLADGQHLLYASNTDEMKEEPAYVQGLLKTYAPKQKAAQIKRASAGPELPAQDLYLQRLDGTQIERLTRVSGFDGEPSYDQIHKHIVFTSTRQGFASLYLMNTEGKVLARLTSDGFYDSTPSFSPDGKALLWVRYASDLKTSQIIVAESDAQKRIVLVNQPALNVQPVWHPNGQEIVFSSNRAGQANYELYSIDRKGACLKRLTDSKSDESLASFSPDGKKLLLTSNQSGRFQIYMMDYVPPSSCLQDQP